MVLQAVLVEIIILEIRLINLNHKLKYIPINSPKIGVICRGKRNLPGFATFRKFRTFGKFERTNLFPGNFLKISDRALSILSAPHDLLIQSVMKSVELRMANKLNFSLAVSCVIKSNFTCYPFVAHFPQVVF